MGIPVLHHIFNLADTFMSLEQLPKSPTVTSVCQSWDSNQCPSDPWHRPLCKVMYIWESTAFQCLWNNWSRARWRHQSGSRRIRTNSLLITGTDFADLASNKHTRAWNLPSHFETSPKPLHLLLRPNLTHLVAVCYLAGRLGSQRREWVRFSCRASSVPSRTAAALRSRTNARQAQSLLSWTVGRHTSSWKFQPLEVMFRIQPGRVEGSFYRGAEGSEVEPVRFC